MNRWWKFSKESVERAATTECGETANEKVSEETVTGLDEAATYHPVKQPGPLLLSFRGGGACW